MTTIEHADLQLASVTAVRRFAEERADYLSRGGIELPLRDYILADLTANNPDCKLKKEVCYLDTHQRKDIGSRAVTIEIKTNFIRQIRQLIDRVWVDIRKIKNRAGLHEKVRYALFGLTIPYTNLYSTTYRKAIEYPEVEEQEALALIQQALPAAKLWSRQPYNGAMGSGLVMLFACNIDQV